jgi:hypothetical protein
MITGLIVLAAIAFLFWPTGKGGTKALHNIPNAEDLFRVPPVPASAPASPDPRQAIDSLLEVRDRLAASEQLDEQASAAVDTLWLDLLHGSRKK